MSTVVVPSNWKPPLSYSLVHTLLVNRLRWMFWPELPG